ncbi:MAG TPA: HAD hydrolase-like protein, partial [Rhodocyclaceae bacterium]|nr:HAD hydrolase-like protein [Rhodocyclaceae bacterium]
MFPYTHYLFDLDGTLIDSAPAILASFREAFARAGVAP